MLDRLLSYIAPHHCYGCSNIGSILCSNCKYNIISEAQSACVVCSAPTSGSGVCQKETLPFTRAWCVGERTDILRHLIDDFKFENVYAAHSSLAGLLSDYIGILPGDITVVPIPTITQHIRQRGYDHAALLAKAFARRQHLPFRSLLLRKQNSMQRGTSKKQRFKQAALAYKVQKPLRGGRYLLIDDVITTGATLSAGAKVLLEAGADEVWVAVIARQPLD